MSSGGGVRIAVLGNCATQFFATAVQGYAALEGLDVCIYDADYNQIDAQLLDPHSEVYAFDPDIIVLWLATEKLYEEFLDMPPAQRSGFAQQYCDHINRYWDLIEKNHRARIFQFNFSEIDDKALGNYSCKVRSSFSFQIRKLNYLLEEAMAEHSTVYPIDLLSIQIALGQDLFYDPALYYHAKMSVSTRALPYIAKAVVDVCKALRGKIKKCLVMDLDNTIWGGVVGDDGPDHIEIGELGRGHAFTDFQRWLKQLKECGILLAVCSKNNEATAKEPFEQNPEMVLRLADISLFVANWEDKAANIRLIQSTLNIGMDSIVFIDDNPFERNLVRQLLPDVEVPELPADPARYLEYLQSCNYFETASFTGEGSDRTKLYQAEMERKKMELTFDSIDDYLKSLEMVGAARPFESDRFARIAQLTQRSNQFNLRTVRYTEDDIRRIAADPQYITLYYTLRDKFGDHGLVAVVIMKKQTEDELFIDTWLMSCRVLKRGMEEYIVNRFVRAARENGFTKLYGEYLPTPKNAMVKDIYEKMGFERIGEGKFSLNVGDYAEKHIYITEDQ